MNKNSSKSLKCPWCDYKPANPTRLIDHSRSHTLEKPFSCPHPSCSFSSALTCGLTAHLQVHSEKKYACSVSSCDYVGKSKRRLKEHNFISHNDDFPFVCSEAGCKAAFKRNNQLQRHVSIVHLEEEEPRNFPCTFPSCAYRAKMRAYLDTHMQSHLGEKGQKCPFEDCDYACVQPGALKSHIRTHTKERPYPCDFDGCDYRATVSSALLSHKRAVHTHEKRYECTLCPYKGITKGYLIRHMMSHTKEKPHKCPHCPAPGKFYGKSENLKQHIISQHPEKTEKKKTQACQDPSCSYQTFSKNALIIHSRIHSGEKPFVCPVESCGYRTTSNSYVKTHYAAHHDGEGRKYKCEYPNCAKAFVSQARLTKHEKLVHETVDKGHKCPLPNCSFATKEMNNLKRHIQTNFCQRVKISKPDFYFCPQDNCRYKSNCKGNLTRHVRRKICQKHNLRKRTNYSCSVSTCRFTTMDLKIVIRHLNDTHGLPKVVLERKQF